MNYTDYKCINCLVKKNINVDGLDLSEQEKTAYTKELLRVIADAPDSLTAPEITERITEVQRRYKISAFDYTQTKRYYNSLILSFENKIRDKISEAKDPLYAAVCYALIGNYIDFGTNTAVCEQKLEELISAAEGIEFDKAEFYNLKKELETAKRLVYLTDNCGEIVFDKIMILLLKKLYPELEISVIVRGKDVLNDATEVDAEQVGLYDITRVISNGIGVAGTVLNRITSQARETIDNADIIISKGMGNFETLNGCGKNVFYLFMCKCEKFCSHFNCPLFTYMLLNDKRMA